MPVSASCSSRKRFSRSSSVVRATQASIRRRAGRTTPEDQDQSREELQRQRAGQHPARPAGGASRGAAGRARRSGRAAAGCGSRTVPAAPPRPTPAGAAVRHRRRHGVDRSLARPKPGRQAARARPRAPPAGRSSQASRVAAARSAPPSGSAASRSSATTTARAAAASLGRGHRELGRARRLAVSRPVDHAHGSASTTARPAPSTSPVARANRRSGSGARKGGHGVAGHGADKLAAAPRSASR